jgi:hypothetical protein
VKIVSDTVFFVYLNTVHDAISGFACQNPVMKDLHAIYTVGQTVRLEFRKWDDRLHYHWDAQILEVLVDRVLVGMQAGTVFHHVTRGFDVRLDHDGMLAFWDGRWYSGGPDFASGTRRVLEYYFNIGTPPEFLPGLIRVIDLELDLKARPDLSLEEFDWDEFHAAKQRFGYPDWLERRVHLAALEVRELLKQREWPVLDAQETSADFGWMNRGSS